MYRYDGVPASAEKKVVVAENDIKLSLIHICAVNVLQTLVVALGAGLGIWGVINLPEG